MRLIDVFKMELYKNRNDKPYLLVIAILTAMTTISTFIGIGLIDGKIYPDNAGFTMALILLIVFSVLGLGIFSLLYPFRLLNVDYKNKVMGLILASGVSREKYYFVKISTTILTCFIATFAILFIPAVTFLAFYLDEFVIGIQAILVEFRIADVFPFMLMLIFSLLAYYVTLTTAVIITKGKIVGILLYFGFSFAVSTIQSMVGVPILSGNKFWPHGMDISFYLMTLYAIVQIIIFGLIGLKVLKKQDL
jgi:ABC-type transport system involved in multi-copper enzyme maturation permease subunit